MFSLLSLFSCENSLLNECQSIRRSKFWFSLSGQERAIAVLNQFRSEVNPNTRSLPDINIKSVKSETYQIETSQQDARTRSNISNPDTIDIYTIVLKRMVRQASICHQMKGLDACLYRGWLNKWYDYQQGLALHLNGIKEICKADFAVLYSWGW